MILLYENVKNRPSGILSLTGLTKAEFESLLPLFEKAEEEYAGGSLSKTLKIKIFLRRKRISQTDFSPKKFRLQELQGLPGFRNGGCRCMSIINMIILKEKL